eukprot:CAMPEP_0179064456 /NCGR_PEP_ID=MMETSP0796-20121207/27958_1 /TAXON_ID=73915 /ORGANISM="Pyrodinium bahamense, Strain pbaha01" /LENGTH=87 /DNA_ID=CAMNT_0020761405 /DNA_START=62 /DNA_END=322 /DNA_ORIENTATION=+
MRWATANSARHAYDAEEVLMEHPARLKLLDATGAHVLQCLLHVARHLAASAQVDLALRVLQERLQLTSVLPDPVLDVALGLARLTGE